MSSSMFLTDFSSYSTACLLPLTRSPAHRSAASIFLPHPADSSHALPLRISTTFQTRPFTINASLTSNDTSAKVIDVMSIANKIGEEVEEQVRTLKVQFGVVPGLGVILVGDSKDSVTKVRSKKEACDAVGINYSEICLPDNASEKEILDSIWQFNCDPSIHGIKLQVPLPSHLVEEKILHAVRLEKDVDGCNPLNIGRLALKKRKEPLNVPCTPLGIIYLLERCKVKIKGKRAVVIGRSNTVGIPLALMLQKEDATVTLIHSRTKNPKEITKQADILIAASGPPNVVRGDWIKPGAVVIDVGTVVTDGVIDHILGGRFVGNVCFEEACEVASAITPVPAGVGPMTLAMLQVNTIRAAMKTNHI